MAEEPASEVQPIKLSIRTRPDGAACTIHFEDDCGEDAEQIRLDVDGPEANPHLGRRKNRRTQTQTDAQRQSNARQSEINESMDGKTDVQLKKLQRCRNVISWLFLFVAGTLTGLIALLVIHVVEKIVHWRTQWAAELVEKGHVGMAMLTFVFTSTG